MVAKTQESGLPETKGPDWTEIRDWEAAIAAAPEIVHSLFALGDGSTLIQKKDDLIDKGEFLVLDWRMVTDKTTNNEYLNVLALFRNGNVKVRFNDSSTSGIMAQLLAWQEKQGGKIVPILCQNVRRSDYTIPDPANDKKQISVTTYYLV